MEEQKAPKPQADWSIGELYQSAINLVKKNKVLWIFAIALGATGSYSIHNTSNFNQKDIQNFQKLFQQHAVHTSDKVLGASTSLMNDTVSYLFSAIQPTWYVLLGAEFLCVLIAGIVISVIYRGWAEAGLLTNIENAIQNKPVTIKDGSESAFVHLKAIIKVRLVPACIVVGIYFASLIITVILGTFIGFPFMITFIVLEILALIICIFLLSFSLIWAVREIVVDKKPAKQAFYAGLTITKKKFWPMAGLGFLNVLLTGVVTGILMIPIFLFFVGGVFIVILLFALKNAIALSIAFFIGMLMLLAAGLVIDVAGGILTAFSTSVWSLAYNKIRGKYDK